ncbi:DNA-processing protein DprA [bacterium]|nr:DNA-processing protein DprA [bacterium]
MNRFEGTSADLLGPLNAVEHKYAPPRLFGAGDRSVLSHSPRIAVVGSRQVSDDGATLAAAVARQVVDHGGLVVSGLALGVDGIAHRTAMESGGRTLAVIGTPLDRSYPREHRDLQDRIQHDHLVLTQFADGSPVQRQNFVLRNRTMALVSHGTIIIEASESSGTKHQGWEAIRLGRILFLPRGLAEAEFDWPRQLIEYGAIVFDGVAELREALDEFLPSRPGTEDRREVPL